MSSFLSADVILSYDVYAKNLPSLGRLDEAFQAIRLIKSMDVTVDEDELVVGIYCNSKDLRFFVAVANRLTDEIDRVELMTAQHICEGPLEPKLTLAAPGNDAFGRTPDVSSDFDRLKTVAGYGMNPLPAPATKRPRTE